MFLFTVTIECSSLLKQWRLFNGLILFLFCMQMKSDWSAIQIVKLVFLWLKINFELCKVTMQLNVCHSHSAGLIINEWSWNAQNSLTFVAMYSVAFVIDKKNIARMTSEIRFQRDTKFWFKRCNHSISIQSDSKSMQFSNTNSAQIMQL